MTAIREQRALDKAREEAARRKAVDRARTELNRAFPLLDAAEAKLRTAGPGFTRDADALHRAIERLEAVLQSTGAERRKRWGDER